MYNYLVRAVIFLQLLMTFDIFAGAFKETRLADNKQQVIVITCGLGGQALLAGKLLKDYGYTNVNVVEGGNKGYKDAGCPLLKFTK